jgi:type VI secretion system secreted protein Hcp
MRSKVLLLVLLAAVAGVLTATFLHAAPIQRILPVSPVDMAAPAVGAPTAITMEVKGSKQGMIPGSGPNGTIAVLNMRHQMTASRDSASGLYTGKIVNSPLYISKAIDRSTPRLYAALTDNETLPTVVIRWYRGSEQYFTITLKNAGISSIATKPGDPTGQFEEVGFDCKNITWTWEADQSSAVYSTSAY